VSDDARVVVVQAADNHYTCNQLGCVTDIIRVMPGQRHPTQCPPVRVGKDLPLVP